MGGGWCDRVWVFARDKVVKKMQDLKIGFMVQEVSLAAGEQIEFRFRGDYVRNMGVVSFSLGLNNGPRSEFPAAAFYRLPTDQEFEVVTIENPTVAAITAKIGIAMGDLGYDALQIADGLVIGSVTAPISVSGVNAVLPVPGIVADAIDQTIVAGGSFSIPAVATRRELHFSFDQDFRWGPLAGLARGVLVKAGGVVVIAGSAAVKIYNAGTAAGTLSYSWLEA